MTCKGDVQKISTGIWDRLGLFTVGEGQQEPCHRLTGEQLEVLPHNSDGREEETVPSNYQQQEKEADTYGHTEYSAIIA